MPLPNIGRSFASLRTTLCVGWEGGLLPLSIEEEISRFVRHDDKWRREKSPPPTPPEINFLHFGVSWEGVFCPFPILGDPSLRSGRQEKGGDPSQKTFRTTHRVGWEGGLLPLPIMCHPERSEGSPQFPLSLRAAFARSLLFQLRGLEITPSRLPQENIKGGDVSLRST